jgi:hypothetical protein
MWATNSRARAALPVRLDSAYLLVTHGLAVATSALGYRPNASSFAELWRTGQQTAHPHPVSAFDLSPIFPDSGDGFLVRRVAETVDPLALAKISFAAPRESEKKRDRSDRSRMQKKTRRDWCRGCQLLSLEPGEDS